MAKKKMFDVSMYGLYNMKTKPSDYLPGRYKQLTIDDLIKEKQKEKENADDKSGE